MPCCDDGSMMAPVPLRASELLALAGQPVAPRAAPGGPRERDQVPAEEPVDGLREPPRDPLGPPVVRDAPEKTRKVSKGASRVLQALTKIPRAYRYVPQLLRFAVVEGLMTTLQLTAGVTGVAGMFGMGLAGGLEIGAGVRERDPVKIVGGAGEMSRGLTLGAVTASEFMDLGPHQPAAATAARGLAGVHAALTGTSGILKIRRGALDGNPRLRVEGVLELGVAGATLAAAGGLAPGPMLGLAVALNGARYVYTHQDGIRAAGRAVADRTHQLWHRFQEIFRDDDHEQRTDD